jgi:hypothetical protein
LPTKPGKRFQSFHPLDRLAHVYQEPNITSPRFFATIFRANLAGNTTKYARDFLNLPASPLSDALGNYKTAL